MTEILFGQILDLMFLAASIGLIIYALLSLYSYRKKRTEAIFTIPTRRIYLLFPSVLLTYDVVHVLFTSQNDSYWYIQLPVMIGMILLFLSGDILILNDGIYCFMKLTRWNEIRNISTDFMTLWLHTKKGIFKRIGYAKFIWIFKNSDIEVTFPPETDPFSI